MKSDRYLLDIEGNLYLFTDKDILKDYLLSEKDIEDEINSSEQKVCYENFLIIFDSENLYEIPEELGRKYMLGQRRLSETLLEISNMSVLNIKPEELNLLTPVIYKIYEEEVLSLCEKEEYDDVRLYTVTAINNKHVKPQTKPAQIKSALNNQKEVKSIKQETQQAVGKAPVTDHQVKQADTFRASTQEENEEKSFFSSIKNLARRWSDKSLHHVGANFSGNYSAGKNGIKVDETIGDRATFQTEEYKEIEGQNFSAESDIKNELSAEEKGSFNREISIDERGLNTDLNLSLQNKGDLKSKREDKFSGENYEVSGNVEAGIHYENTAESDYNLNLNNGIKIQSGGSVSSAINPFMNMSLSGKKEGEEDKSGGINTGLNMKSDMNGKNTFEVTGNNIELGTRGSLNTSFQAGNIDISKFGYNYETNISKSGIRNKDELNIGFPSGIMSSLLNVGKENLKGEVGVEAIKGNINVNKNFEVSKDAFEIGGGFSADASLASLTEAGKGSFKTKAGSGVNIEVSGSQGIDAGTGAEAGLRIDREGIHIRGGVLGKLGPGVDIKGQIDLNPEDLKKPEFIIGSILGGAAGLITGPLAVKGVEYLNENNLNPLSTGVNEIKKYFDSPDINPLKRGPAIDTTDTTDIDNTIVKSLALSDMKFGEKKTIKGDFLAKLGIGAGGIGEAYIGSGQKYSLVFERDKKDPNKFVMTIESGGQGKIGGAIHPEGIPLQEKNKYSLEDKMKMSFDLDLSKKGEAKDMLGFIAHERAINTLIAADPTKVTGAVNTAGLIGVEQIPGFDIPGEPLEFIKNHFKSAEFNLSGGKTSDTEIGKIIGIDREMASKITGGGKVEKHDDGSWSMTESLSGEREINTGLFLKGSIDKGIKAGGSVNTDIAEESGKFSLENVTTVNKDGSKKEELLLKLNMEGNMETEKGSELEMSVTMGNLMKNLPSDTGTELQSAINDKDYDRVSRIFEEKVMNSFYNPELELNGTYRTFKRSNVEVGLTGGWKAGKNIGVDMKTEIENELPLSSFEGRMYLSKEEIKLGLEGETIKWSDFLQEKKDISDNIIIPSF